MKISNVLSSIADPAALAKRSDLMENGSTSETKKSAGGESAQASQSAAALREILSKYDVKDISPDEFSEMIQKLADKGVISQKELQDLSAVRADLDKAGVGADESINLVEFYQQRIQEAENAAKTDPTSAGQNPTGPLASRLEWVEKFVAMHAQPESLGLNAVA